MYNALHLSHAFLMPALLTKVLQDDVQQWRPMLHFIVALL